MSKIYHNQDFYPNAVDEDGRPVIELTEDASYIDCRFHAEAVKA